MGAFAKIYLSRSKIYLDRRGICCYIVSRKQELAKTGPKEANVLSIASDIIRGHTDAIILALLSAGDSYGYEINKSIVKKTNGKYELKEATLYTAFRRLEENGCITSYWGNEQTGARRRYYAITENGKRTLSSLRTEWAEARAMINSLTGTED